MIGHQNAPFVSLNRGEYDPEAESENSEGDVSCQSLSSEDNEPQVIPLSGS